MPPVISQHSALSNHDMLKRELQSMSPSARRKRTIAARVSEEEMDDAEESTDPHGGMGVHVKERARAFLLLH